MINCDFNTKKKNILLWQTQKEISNATQRRQDRILCCVSVVTDTAKTCSWRNVLSLRKSCQNTGNKAGLQYYSEHEHCFKVAILAMGNLTMCNVKGVPCSDLSPPQRIITIGSTEHFIIFQPVVLVFCPTTTCTVLVAFFIFYTLFTIRHLYSQDCLNQVCLFIVCCVKFPLEGQ